MKGLNLENVTKKHKPNCLPGSKQQSWELAAREFRYKFLRNEQYIAIVVDSLVMGLSKTAPFIPTVCNAKADTGII